MQEGFGVAGLVFQHFCVCACVRVGVVCGATCRRSCFNYYYFDYNETETKGATTATTSIRIACPCGGEGRGGGEWCRFISKSLSCPKGSHTRRMTFCFS